MVVAADDVPPTHLLPWIGAGFLATGAAATDDVVEDAALPFDRRRHGMILGMGAAAIVVESADAARERGLQPICEVLATVTANSAFHGTRLDVDHIAQVMEELLRQAEARGVRPARDRRQHGVRLARDLHPGARRQRRRGDQRAAHGVRCRRRQVVVTNTKGFTGHAMGAGIEDVVAVKALETGIVPPVPNFGDRSGARRAEPVTGGTTRSSTRCGWPPGSARRSHDAAAPDAVAHRSAAAAGSARLPVPDRGRVGLAQLAAPYQRAGRPGGRGRFAPAARGRPRALRTPVPSGPGRGAGSRSGARSRSPCRPRSCRRRGSPARVGGEVTSAGFRSSPR